MGRVAAGIALLTLFGLGSLVKPLAAAEPDRPNVLVLFTDDQRADTIAALGNSIIKTPNLDRLAARGVSFQRAYMMGGLQGATCVPSRAMLLSGQSLFRIDERLQRHETWPAAFGKAGYSTFLTGKWHNGEPSVPLSFQSASSVFMGGMANPLKANLRSMDGGKLKPAELAPKHTCEMFADEAVRFLKERKSGPFLCYVAFNGPHDPHIVPDDFSVQYDAKAIPLPSNFLPQHPWDNGDMSLRDEALLPWPRSEGKIREMIAEYYRYVSFVDQQIGRILDALDASPFAKDTIVVFAADSGVARGSHGLIGKQNLYEHSLKVPLIVAGPGVARNQRTDAMVYLWDVLPTVGKLCRVSGPTSSEGRDFSGVLNDPLQPGRSRMMFAYRNIQRAIRDDRWKLIRYPQVDKTQLFDLKSDPQEVTNLADLPEHRERVVELTRLLEQEQRANGDALPLKSDAPKSPDWKPPLPKAKAAEKKAKGKG